MGQESLECVPRRRCGHPEATVSRAASIAVDGTRGPLRAATAVSWLPGLRRSAPALWPCLGHRVVDLTEEQVVVRRLGHRVVDLTEEPAFGGCFSHRVVDRRGAGLGRC